MSVFMCSKETISSIVSYIFDNPSDHLFIDDVIGLLRITYKVEKTKESLFDFLTNINKEAVEKRYHETLELSDFNYVDTNNENLYQLFKNIQCYNYQISGHGEEFDDKIGTLAIILLTYMRMIAAQIVLNSPEYEEAKWG